MSRTAKIIVAVVVLVLVVGAVAVFAAKSGGSGPQIKTATVSQAELGVTVSASGKVVAGVRADVYPPAPGTLAFVYVKDGQSVQAGDKIASMDTGPLELQLQQAKSGLAQACAALKNVGATGVSSSDIAAAKAGVAAAKAAYDAAKAAADNVSGPTSGQLAAALAARDAAQSAYQNAVDYYNFINSLPPSPSQATSLALAATQRDQAHAGYLSAKSAYDSLAATNLSPAHAQAKAGVAQAFAAYKSAQASLSKAQAANPASQRAAAQSAVAAAAEAVRVAEDTLDRATMVAPIAGTVFFNAAGAPGADGKTPLPAVGSAVAPAAAPFSVVDMGGSTFTAEVDEADIDRVKLGMSATVTLDAFPGQTFNTTVVRINPAAQPTATGGTIFPVDLAITAPDKTVLLGMKGDATIKVTSIQGALTIPVEALFNENSKNFVYKVVDSKLVQTDITVGATTDTEVEVLEGLKKGDVVALSGATQYTNGMTVRVKN